MEIIQAIIPFVIDYTISPLTRQIGYAFKYKSKVEKLRAQVEQLKGRKESLDHEADEAKRKGEEIENIVQNWFVIVDKAIEESENLMIQGEEQAKTRCFIGLCPNLKAQYELGRTAAKQALALVELQDKANKLRPISHLPPPQQIVASSVISRERLSSRLSILKEVMDLLKDPNLNMIGVFGMGGVGKTTLVKEVHRLAVEEKFFNVVAMTDVSETPEVKKIQVQIADAVGLKFEEETDSVKAWRLQQRLMKERRVLIILDNIWVKMDLEAIGIPTKNIHSGCKILLTSRYENVLTRDMGAQRVRRLDPLADEEAKILFDINAGDGNSPLPPEAADIADKCGGLPLLLVTIANSLKNRSPHAWKDTLTRLLRFDNKEVHAKLYSVLESTYDRLPGEEAKHLFLLCGLFGTSEVSIRDLLRCSMGRGLLNCVETVEEARNRVYSLIDDLKASCLLLDSDKNGYVKIHDIVREVAVSIASKAQHTVMVRDGIVLNEWPSKVVLSSCTKIISLPHTNILCLPESLDCPEIEFLYLHTDHVWKTPNSVFEGCSKLRVLDFRGTSFMSLPPSLSNLTNLRTLCLDQCTLWDISEIGGLKKLEILSLVSSDVVRLPRETEQLTQLRILDLSNCQKLKFIPANVISRLSLLEELYMDSFVKWEVEEMENNGNKNVSLDELEHLSHLTTLEIRIPDAKMLPKGLFSKNFGLERFSLSIGNVFSCIDYKTSRILWLELHMDMLEYGVKVLLSKTQELHLCKSMGFNSLVCDLDGGGFQSLEHLEVNDASDIQYIIDSEMRELDCNAFPILETLSLFDLTGLEKICHGGVGAGSFSKLRELSVSGCDRLKNLFSISLFNCFSRLREIRVTECENMEEIIGDDEFHGNDDENQVVVFNQLCSLKLGNLPKLRTFCSKRSQTKQKQLTAEPSSSQETQSARRTPVPLFSEMVRFPNLENLKLSAIDCNACFLQDCFPNLENLELSSINCQKIWDDQTFITSSSLTRLIVKGCRHLMYLFPYSVAKSLSQLKTLEISNCDFTEIIERNTNGAEEKRKMKMKIAFLKLDFLKLTNLPNLIGFCNGYSIECQSLRELEIASCSSLKTIISSCPSATTISDKGDFQRNQQNYSLFYETPLSKLAKLEVRSCGSVKEVFGLDGAISDDEALVGLMSSLCEMCLIDLPRLRYICEKDLRGVLNLSQIKLLEIINCNSLKYAFTRPLASHLQNIHEIKIQDCIMMRGFIQEKGADEAVLDHEICFYSLKKITISNCPGMKMLVSTFSRESELIVDDEGKEQKLSKTELHTSTVAHINHKLFPNLEELSLDGMATIMKTMKSLHGGSHKVNFLEISSYRGRSLNFLRRLQNIKEVCVRYSSFIGLFQSGGIRDDEEDAKLTLSLKKLELDGIGDLEHIWEEDSKSDPTLQNLETLDVSDCQNLTNLAPSSSSLRNLTILEVNGCGGLINLVSSAAAKSLVQLITLRIQDCRALSQIIADEQQHGTAQEQEDIVMFNKLKTLELIYLQSLTSFCLGNYAFTFPSLELVFVEGCPKLRTFCVGVLKTPVLESVQVTNHSYDKRRHWEGDLNTTIHQLYLEMEMVSIYERRLSGFPHVNELYNAPNQLKISKRFSGLHELVVDECAFDSCVITFRALQLFQFLKKLIVGECDSALQLFDFEGPSPEGGHVGLMSQLHSPFLIDLPRLRVTWENDVRGILCFKNLEVLEFNNCSSLTKIFSLSMALGLVKLREIRVKKCNLVEAIVTKDEEQQPAWDGRIFPSLKSITVEHLPSLTSFYSGSEVLKFPALEEIVVSQCPKMRIHAYESSWEREHIKEAIGEENSNVLPVSSFCDKKMFPNLKELSFDGNAIMMTAQSPLLREMIKNSQLTLLKLHSIWDKSLASSVPSFLGRSVGSLNKLRVENCFLEELFKCKEGGRVGGGDVEEEEDVSCITLPPIIGNLELNQIHGLKYIWNQDSQLDSVVLQHLEVLTLERCYDLIKLAPFSLSPASFQSLTTLHVFRCRKIIYLMSSSVAKSMVQLDTMRIAYCDRLTGIVADLEQEDGAIREVGEIVFSKLTALELNHLHNLANFCSDNYTFTFPSLEKVVAETCPKLKIFCVGTLRTPKLESVVINSYKKKSVWEGDIDATIQHMYAEMVGLDDLQKLKLSEFPHLKEKWHDQIQFKSLCNLTELVVDNCTLFSTALSSNQLQYLNSLFKLSIEKCDSLEQIFDLQDLDPDEGQLRLKWMQQLHLIGLPKLRQVWNKNSHRILGFQNLQSLIIHDCTSLTNIFTLSLALGLLQLRDIEIKRCDSVQEIISKGGEEEEKETDVIFPTLTSITLESLPNVLSFYAGSGTVICPSLEKIDVVECPKMKIISSKIPGEQDSNSTVVRMKRRLCEIDSDDLFFGGKVAITSLKGLRVEWNVFMKEIWHIIYQRRFLDELEIIELTQIPNDWDYLPSDFFEKLPYLENLFLSDSFLVEIFPSDSSTCKEKHPRSLEAHLRKVKLSKLPTLKYLMDSQAVPIFHHLEDLEVHECSRLQVLVPPSVSFTNLKTLDVWKCDGLMSLMTPPTARSLVHLMRISIRECGSIQEIIGSEGDRAEDEICFSQLKYLGLQCLPCLTGFHSGNHAISFPSLVKVTVKECSQMRIFARVVSTPRLWRIQTVEDIELYWEGNWDGDEWHWEGNVNNTMQKLFTARNIQDAEEATFMHRS